MRAASIVASFALLAFIWGSTWAAIKVGYGGLGPFNAAALRFLIAGPLLLAALPFLRVPLPSGRQWRTVAWVGTLTFGVNYACVYWGEQSIDSGLAAVLFGTSPILTVLLGHWLLPDERLTWRRGLGAVLAFAGVVVLMADRLRIDLSAPGPMVAILVAGCAAGLGNVLTRRDARAIHPAALTAFAMTFGGTLLAALALASGEGLRLPTDGGTWAAILYLAVVGSIAGFVLLFTLLKHVRAAAASYVYVVMPVVALSIGFVALRERPTWGVVVGALLVMLATLAANWEPRRSRPRPSDVGGGEIAAGGLDP